MSIIIPKKNIYENMLLNPAKDYDKLCIVSGFATPSMASYHLGNIKEKFDRDDTKISIIVGMTPIVKISKAHHKNFVKISDERDGLFDCSYIAEKTPIHSKLYIWLKENNPQIAFISSANYTYTAFKGNQDEIASECNPEKAFEYYKSVISSSLYCTHDDAEDFVIDNIVSSIEKRTSVQDVSEREQITATTDNNSVELPLFSIRDKDIQSTAGLNWGQRAGREKNQAYIHIPAKIAKGNFFPPIGVHFSVLTDDNIPFVCVRAQPKIKGGNIGYGIETPNNNSELGEYFRRKLGLQPGEFVKLEDLDRYGNRYVIFTKINDDEYYMQYPKNQA